MYSEQKLVGLLLSVDIHLKGKNYKTIKVTIATWNVHAMLDRDSIPWQKNSLERLGIATGRCKQRWTLRVQDRWTGSVTRGLWKHREEETLAGILLSTTKSPSNGYISTHRSSYKGWWSTDIDPEWQTHIPRQYVSSNIGISRGEKTFCQELRRVIGKAPYQINLLIQFQGGRRLWDICRYHW